jgi:hypothetical protein
MHEELQKSNQELEAREMVMYLVMIKQELEVTEEKLRVVGEERNQKPETSSYLPLQQRQ